MKKIRFAALLCILVLIVSVCASASAKTVTRFDSVSRGTIETEVAVRTVSNGKTVSLFVPYSGYDFYEQTKDGLVRWDDLEFDFEGPLKAESSVDWIQVNQYKRSFELYVSWNDSRKTRSGKVTVTGKNFKATVKIQQFGRCAVTSVVRKKNEVTVKMKPSSYLEKILDPNNNITAGVIVDMSRTDEDGTNISKDIVSEWRFDGKAVTFKVKKGWEYRIMYGTAFHYKDGGTLYWDDGVSFTVTTTKGTETIR